MKITFEFDDTKPEFAEYREGYKLYAMQNAEMLGFSIEQIFDRIRNWEKNDKYNVSTDELRDTLLEILDNNGISLDKLGY